MLRFSSVVLIDPRGWLLLQERDEHPVIDPERWGFPGGGVEEGESFEEAAYRELEEETGVRLEPGQLALFSEYDVAVHDRHAVCQLWVSSTGLTDADIECHEGRQIVFVDPAVAPTLELTVAARISLPQFLTSETYRSLIT